MKTKLLLALLFCLAPALGLTQGFDNNYEVRYGDINGDGLTDLYVRQKPQIVILHGDIATPILVPAPVQNFILSNSGNGSFTRIAPSNSQAATALAWSIANIDFYIQDIDFNGSADLILANVSDVIEGALDQIVFSAGAKGEPPSQVTALSQQLQNFIMQAHAWSLDPGYFDDNAPWVIDGIEPTSRVYFGTVFSSSNIWGINWLLAECTSRGYLCATTSMDPPSSECNRYQPVYNEFGEYVGHAWINVCAFDTHVFRYVPGSVIRKKSYAYFNQRALQYADEIEAVMPGGVFDIGSTDPVLVRILNGVLKAIIRGEFGPGLFDNDPNMDERSNTLLVSCQKKYGHDHFEHKSFVSDNNYVEQNPSFHHYDVETNACNDTQGGCSTQSLRDVLRLYSFPNEGLQPKETPLDGVTDQLAYFAPPGLVHKPWAYQLPLGPVSQHLLSDGNWPDAIQNRTRTIHMMHPGTVSRTIVSKNGSKFIFTHGIGENDRGTLLDGLTGGSLGYQSSQAINMFLGCMNDIYGPETFKTLDRQAIKFWKNQNQMQGLMAVQQPSLSDAVGTFAE